MLSGTSLIQRRLVCPSHRCTTSCLLCFLTITYPRCAIIFQGLITLDFSSHYIHMYSSLLTGATSHKLVTSDVSWILWYYYNDSVRVAACACAKSECESVQCSRLLLVGPPNSARCSSTALATRSFSSACT